MGLGLESGTLTMMLIQLPAAPPPPPPDVAVAAVLAARASAPASAPAYPVLCSVVHDKRSVLETGVVLLGLARNHDEYGGPAFMSASRIWSAFAKVSECLACGFCGEPTRLSALRISGSGTLTPHARVSTCHASRLRCQPASESSNSNCVSASVVSATVPKPMRAICCVVLAWLG